MSGTLYVVASPIGNLTDITNRALETLKSVDLVISEDTRVTGNLLKHFDIKVNLLSYHQRSPESRKQEILLKLLEGKDIALVTDAGTPGISDPGNELIEFVLSADPTIKIVPIPGSSSLTTSLSVSGFDVSKFVFIGFLGKKKGKKLLKDLKPLNIPIVFFESPYRLVKTLEALEEIFGSEKKIFIAREMTKIYETFYRGTLREVKEILGTSKVRGEVVVILSGAPGGN